MRYDGVLMTGTCQWQWHCVCVWGRVRVCVCWGNLAGPVDDGRVMRWSRAVEIRPVCPQRLPPTRHTHTHSKPLALTPHPLHQPTKLPHNATCYLTNTHTTLLQTHPPHPHPIPTYQPSDHQCHGGSHQRHQPCGGQWGGTCSRTRGSGTVSPRCEHVCAVIGGTAWWRRSCRAYIWRASLLWAEGLKR